MINNKAPLLFVFFLLIILYGILCGLSLVIYNFDWFFWQSIVLLYAIWLFIDQKDKGLLKSSFQTYLIYFTIYAPIGLLQYVYQTRKKHLMLFFAKGLLLFILSILLFNASKYCSQYFLSYSLK